MRSITKGKMAALLCMLVTAITVSIATNIQASEVDIAEKDAKWNYDAQFSETRGAFTYHAYVSVDETEAWIYKIEINKKKKYSSLEIPEELDDKSVTRIGYTSAGCDFSEIEAYDKYTNKNLFHIFIDRYHVSDGGRKEIDGIKKITIPDSVEVIQPGTFSGMNYITEIKIPKKVKVIDEELFYGCDRLKTIYLPAGLKKIDVTALEDCPKLSKMKLSSKNKVYSIKNSCVIEKKSQALIYVLPYKGTFKIPDGVKTIRTFAFDNCTSSTVYIPASVKKIEGRAFFKASGRENKNIKNVTVSKKNKVYAKDGQCIYNKKDKSLSVAIPDSKGVLRISDKIERLTDTYSMVNCYLWDKKLQKVVISKNLEYVEIPAFAKLTDAKKVYFMGEEPPEVVRPEGVSEGWAALPVFVDLYVPKKSAELYKSWYKEYDCYRYLNHFYKFDPKKYLTGGQL